MYLKEPIPNEDHLFCRVHHTFCKKGKPSASAFTNTPKDGDNLSSDWNKYATATSSRDLIAKQRNNKGEYKNHLDFYIYEFNVAALRNITIRKQEVEHDPIYSDPEIDGTPNNQAHSIIIGDKGDNNNTEIRLKLVDIGRWSIPPDVDEKK